MEKLIELLNEYEGKPSWCELRGSIWFELDEVPYDDYIITKKFGFIKWLVENDKIDLGKIKKLYRKSNENSIHTYPILYDYSYDESLLMYLSIQDEPIEFLVSILK